jgi:DNA polymerase III subunit epsilon
MLWLITALILAAVIYAVVKQRTKKPNLSILPERFVVLDLETTGLRSDIHEIIEIGAIRVNRDSTEHDGFQTLVKPEKKIPKKITELTGITQEMVEREGVDLDKALRDFVEFAGELPLVTFNAEFDMAFLNAATAATQTSSLRRNSVSCALKMARRAWPGRKSYRLADLARDGGLSTGGSHRALDDCKRALIVYTAAASKLGRAD